jgi:hypothetical protein
MLILEPDPSLGVRIFALAFARQAALPAIGVEQWPTGVPVHLAEIAFDVIEEILVLLHDVSVCIDDQIRHWVPPELMR